MAATRGQAIIIAAIALPALAGSAALAVDVGHMYVAKSAIQNAVDAGSRAGAAILAGGGTQAEAGAEATSFASQNLAGIAYLASATPVVTFPTATSVNVAIDHNLDLFFAPVIGIDTASIAAGATASLASVSAVGSGELIPLAIYCNNAGGCAGVLNVGQSYALRRYCGNFFKDGADGNGCGNAIADGEVFLVGITFDNSNSNSAFRTAVREGYPGEVGLNQEARALPGNRNGWRSGMTDRLSAGDNETIMPIITKLEPLTNNYNIQIADFVKVDISSFAISGSTDTTTLQIIRGAVSTTDFADSNQGLGIESVVGVRLSN